VVGVAGCEDDGAGGQALDLVACPVVVLVRVQPEKKLPPVRHVEAAPDEVVAVLGLPVLP
jgi:hypothetical protein